MKKVVLIDDEPLARSLLKEYLSAYPEFQIVDECSNGFDGVKSIQSLAPDLIFLDVRMPKLNGFEMLELLDHMPSVIFTTAFDEYAMKAFDANATDYLLKPISQDRFDKAIGKFLLQENSKEIKQLVDSGSIRNTEDYETRIAVKSGHDIRIIPIDEISYIESYDDYVKIHVNESVFVKKKTMAYYEENLNPKRFIRIHRSFIVNLDKIQSLTNSEGEKQEVKLIDGKCLGVSRSGIQKLREVFGA